MLLVRLHHAEIVSGEENHSRRETATLLKNTVEGDTQQAEERTDSQHSVGRKGSVPLSPWKLGVLLLLRQQKETVAVGSGRESHRRAD